MYLEYQQLAKDMHKALYEVERGEINNREKENQLNIIKGLPVVISPMRGNAGRPYLFLE